MEIVSICVSLSVCFQSDLRSLLAWNFIPLRENDSKQSDEFQARSLWHFQLSARNPRWRSFWCPISLDALCLKQQFQYNKLSHSAWMLHVDLSKIDDYLIMLSTDLTNNWRITETSVRNLISFLVSLTKPVLTSQSRKHESKRDECMLWGSMSQNKNVFNDFSFVPKTRKKL